MTTNFKFNNGGTITDFDDVFIKKELFSSGGLWGCGSNSAGALGDNTTVPKSSPVQTVSGGTNWKQVSCGQGHTASIKTDGSLWLWGANGGKVGKTFTVTGQLGTNTTIPRSSPVQTVSGGTNWKQVSCGSLGTGAIKTDGTLWLWGASVNGELGNNSTLSRSSPVQTISGGTNWKQVAFADQHVSAIKTDGTLWLWGANGYGQLGDNSIVRKSSPVQTVSGGTTWKQVSCAGGFTGAIKTDGTLWMWGRNSQGQLGNNSTVDTSSPIQTVSATTTWKQVSCAGTSTVAIKTDGTLWAWGNNNESALGDNTTISKSSPVQTVAGGTNWKFVNSNSNGSTVAIKTDGTLWAWGYGYYGNLGNNNTNNLSSPTQIAGTNWVSATVSTFQFAGIRE